MGSSSCCHAGYRANISILIGRILVGLTFLLSGINKFTNWDSGVSNVSNAGLPWAEWVYGIAVLFLVLGGISLILGYKTRLGALLLLLVVVPTTFVFHNWNGDKVLFWAHVAFIGGLLVIAGFGAGRYSFDACCSKCCKGNSSCRH